MEDEPIPLPGSDAERRAHLRLAQRLRDGGRTAAVETHWVRPRWELAHALHAALGVAASVVAVGVPAVGLGLAVLALVSLLGDLSGRLFLLRRLTPERATENVVSPAPATAAPGRAAPLRLLLTTHCDAPRGGVLRRFAARERERRRLPGPYTWLVLSLLLVAGCAAVRLGSGDGAETAIGAVQLVPTLVLLVALWLFVDAALAGPAPAVDVSETLLAVTAALDAAPPRNLAVDVVVAGAGEGQAVGFLAHLRRHRPRRESAVVVELTGSAGPPRWLVSDGPLLPLRYHPVLVGLARRAAEEERPLDARPARGHALGAATRARQRRLPAIRLAADGPAAVAFLLTLVELLDDDLGRG